MYVRINTMIDVALYMYIHVYVYAHTDTYVFLFHELCVKNVEKKCLFC